MKLTLESTHEADGRWLAEVPQLDGVLAYADSELGALAKAQALGLRVLAEQIEAGSCPPGDVTISIAVEAGNEVDAEIVPSLPADQAAYDAWLAAEVQEALDDNSPTMSTEEVMRYVGVSMLSK